MLIMAIALTMGAAMMAATMVSLSRDAHRREAARAVLAKTDRFAHLS